MMTCPQRAHAAVMGVRQFSEINHNFYNYEYYYNVIKNLPKIRSKQHFVLRTEHLAQDWDRTVEMLGGGPKAMIGEKLFSSKLRVKRVKSEIQSPEAIKLLCHYMC